MNSPQNITVKETIRSKENWFEKKVTIKYRNFLCKSDKSDNFF